MVYIQFLVEDISGAKLIDAVMKKYRAQWPDIEIAYDNHSYKGIGGLRRGPDAQTVKAQQLLNDLPKRLRALDVTLREREDAAVFIVLDNDCREREAFREQLEQMATEYHISIAHTFCVAVEEMEAWLLGDRAALQQAYPKLADRIATKLPNYQQDSICGTWEFLADMLTKGGLSAFRKKNPTAYDVGRCKCEWAERIGNCLDLRSNLSPSFQYMLSALDAQCGQSIGGR